MTKVCNFEQVWEVRMWKADPSNSESRSLVSSSRVTLITNLPVPSHAKDAAHNLKKYVNLWITYQFLPSKNKVHTMVCRYVKVFLYFTFSNFCASSYLCCNIWMELNHWFYNKKKRCIYHLSSITWRGWLVYVRKYSWCCHSRCGTVVYVKVTGMVVNESFYTLQPFLSVGCV